MSKTYTQEEFDKKLTEALDEAKTSKFKFNIDQEFVANGLTPRINITLTGGNVNDLWKFGIDLEKMILDYASKIYN